MNADPNQAKSIFLEAVEKHNPDQWPAFLDQACAGQPDLRRHVEVLLGAHRECGTVQHQAAAEVPVPICVSGSAESPGTVIGPYKLLQQIGEGGMGTVFMAEQTHPVQRKVALKLIKSGMDSRQVVGRFEAERQALALMDHPNIAKVLDAGTTQSGRPYFVMELVKGVPITRYCDEHLLTPRQRLELFMPVCQAVQHAHQKGIIHRDLKPSNVMVCLYDGKPVPKVIDFGVAKAAGQRLTEKTLFTELGQVVGTLEYMSPEQAELNQLDIDTRSDIYSLGVLLYELLTGTTPLERKRFKAVAFLEVLRLIREEESPKPSTRLSTTEGLPSIAANRGLEPKKLSGLMRGELDWIVMKCLEKDRNRRYETANGFAMDVQRYLVDEPVAAGPPSSTYRLKKFLRRNKGPVLAVVLVLLALVGGIIGTTLGLLQAQASEEQAQDQAWKAGRERDQANAARAAERKAKKAERVQRKRSEVRGKKLRHNLYFAQMNLAGQASEFSPGLARVADLLSPWRLGQPDLRGWEWYYLLGLCHQDVLTIPVSSKGARSVAWSPDGTRLATRGGGTKVWDAVTGKEAVILVGATPDYGFPVAWSPDGTLLASANVARHGEGMITVWDAVTGKKRHTFQGGVGSMAWAPDGTRLASGSRAGTFKVLDATAGKATSAIVDASIAATTVKVLDARTGKATLVLKGHTGPVWSLAWSRDGTHLASADHFGTVKIWDGATGKERRHMQAIDEVHTVSWSPDGKRLASGSFSGCIQIWDTATAKQQLLLSSNGGTVHSLAWSPDGKRLASGTHDGQVRIWDAATGKATAILRGHSAPVHSVAWRPDGKRLASASDDGTVKVWDAHQKNEPLPLKGHKNTVNSVSWSPSGKCLASGSSDGTVKVWDAATGNEAFSLKGHTREVESVAWNVDGTRLASASRDQTITIWEAATGKEIRTLKGHTGGVSSVAWSSDGTQLASGDANGTVKIWDPVTWKGTRTFKFYIGVNDGLNSVCWSPDGTRLASACTSGTVRIFNAVTGQPTCILKGHMTMAYAVAWCPAGARLATASRDRSVKIWATATGKEILTLKGHTGSVAAVAWSSDGKRLASCDWGTVKIWDPVTGKEAITLKAKGSAPVAWSPDGLRLAVGCSSGTTMIFAAANGYRLAGRSGPGANNRPPKAPGFKKP